VAHADYDMIAVSDHARALAESYSSSKRSLAHAYLNTDVEASALKEYASKTGISVLGWLAKAAAHAVDPAHNSVGVIQAQEDGVTRAVFSPASDWSLEEMEAAVKNNGAFDSSSASINVFEHSAMRVAEIIPTANSRMAVSVGGEFTAVGISDENTPKVVTRRSISLTFDAATVDAAEAASTLERFSKVVESPGTLLL